MKLKIQVLDETNSVVFEGAIDVPSEIPYAPEEIQNGPITLRGLKTAIDYQMFEDRKRREHLEAEGKSTCH